jgi:signal peptidase II
MILSVGVLFLLDQLTKQCVLMFPKVFDLPYLTLVHNTGVAFGLFGQHTLLLTVINVIILSLIYFFRKSIFPKSLFGRVALIMILAGGFGNLTDRVLYGYVIDFIDIQIIPVFNFADIFLNIGIICVLLGTLKKPEGKNNGND